MKKTVNRNQFETAIQDVWAAYAPFLGGNPTGLLGVVSIRPLGEAATRALESSAPALGFGSAGCCYITLAEAESNGKSADTLKQAQDSGATAETPTQAGDGSMVTLGAFDLRTLVEACDPTALVACDATSAQMLSHAYGTEVATGRASRVMGRTCVAFVELEAHLSTTADKQKVWHLLKQLIA